MPFTKPICTVLLSFSPGGSVHLVRRNGLPSHVQRGRILAMQGTVLGRA
jgi:hypothetical protein